MDYEAEGLLEGLDGDARDERVELLDYLLGEGFTEDQLREAHADGLLLYLPAERAVMGGGATLTAREVADRAGVELDLLERLRRAQGLPVLDPDEVAFTETDMFNAAIPGGFAQLGFSEEQMLAVTRVLGRGLAQAALVMRATALENALVPGATERELAERYGQTVESVMPYIGPLVEQLLRMHLRNMVRSEGVDAAQRASGSLPGARPVGVAFADLVGFTRLGEEVPAEELGRVADRLADIAGAVAHAPVRMVKTIGDAAMLVSDDAAALVDAGLLIVEAVAAEAADFPQVRVGLAHGEATVRGGDWFGRPVNTASRVTAIARVGSVLATQELRDVAGDDAFSWSHAGARALKGVPEPVRLYRARRLD